MHQVSVICYNDCRKLIRDLFEHSGQNSWPEELIFTKWRYMSKQHLHQEAECYHPPEGPYERPLLSASLLMVSTVVTFNTQDLLLVSGFFLSTGYWHPSMLLRVFHSCHCMASLSLNGTLFNFFTIDGLPIVLTMHIYYMSFGEHFSVFLLGV